MPLRLLAEQGPGWFDFNKEQRVTNGQLLARQVEWVPRSLPLKWNIVGMEAYLCADMHSLRVDGQD